MENTIIRQKRLGISILAVALAALLLVTACAPAPIVEEKTVEIGGIFSLTGGAGASVQINMAAALDYIRYFNEQEAIPGVSIKLTWGDCMGQYAMFCSQYEKFVARDIPLIFTMEALGIAAFKDRFAKDEVVVFGDGMGFVEMSYSPGPWRYFSSPTTAEHFAVVAEYFRENWEEARPPRLAFIVIDHPWGRDPVAEGTKYAQSLGFEVLAPEFVPFVVLDATPQLLRLKDEGADFVYMQTLIGGTGPILKDAERLGLLGQMRFAVANPGISEGLIEMAGGEGFVVSYYFPLFHETEVPGIRLMIDNQMKYHGKVQRETAYSHGWIMAAIGCEGIRRAIENVGYDNLDSAAIKEALDNMEDFDVYGLVSVTYKDRPLDHRGCTKLAVYQVKDGKIVRVSDWREAPMLVPEGLIRD